MHTYLYRLNTLFTIASTALAVICVATSLTDWTIRPDPQVKLAVQSFDGLQVCTGLQSSQQALVLQTCIAFYECELNMTILNGLQKEYRNDRAWLTLNLEADLRSVFHWNTKQVLFSSHGHAVACFESKSAELSLPDSPSCCAD